MHCISQRNLPVALPVPSSGAVQVNPVVVARLERAAALNTV